jgi:hypothetical protein
MMQLSQQSRVIISYKMGVSNILSAEEKEFKGVINREKIVEIRNQGGVVYISTHMKATTSPSCPIRIRPASFGVIIASPTTNAAAASSTSTSASPIYSRGMIALRP